MGGMNRCVAVTAALLLGAAATAVAQSVELNVPFVEGAGHKQQLDLYTPVAAGYPTLLFVHGGSLYSGDRKDEPHERICATFVELGIACAAASYRLAPDHKWPAQPDDVASAFAWLHRNIADRGGDPERIFLFGHSSGCLIVASLAADEKYLARAGHEPADLAGAIPLGCRLDDYLEVTETRPRRYEVSAVHTSRVDEFLASEEAFTSLEQRIDAVPSMHVGENLPPTLILIAERERFFPPILRDASEFVGRALSANGDAAIDLVVLDDRRHMTALERMVTVEDPGVQVIREFVETGVPRASANTDDGTGANAGAPADATEEVHRLADEYLEAWTLRNPEAATFWGVPEARHDRLTDESPEARHRWRAIEDRLLAALDSLPEDELRGTPEEPLYAVFRDALERSVAVRVCRRHLWDLHHMLGWQAGLVSLARSQPVGDDASRAAALARLGEIPRFVDQEIENLRRGLEVGYAAPLTVTRGVRRQLENFAAQDAGGADLLDPIRRDSTPAFADSAAVLWRDRVAPALARMATFLETEYEGNTRETDGIGSLPDSDACYRAQVRYYTTLDEDPAVLFERGRRALDELVTTRDSLAEALGYESASAAMAAAAALPENRFSSREDMIAFAQSLVERAREASPEYFGRIAKLPLVVEPVPEALESGAAGGQYFPGTADGSRPGVYRLNTANWANASGVGLETLTFHEGIPGHHQQLALPLERDDAHPLTRYLFNSGFGEGWALYAELLADEMGLFTGPAQRLAMYNSLIFRAGRLVVDPGLHARGWTREQALQLFSDAMGIPHNAMANEVDRYMAGPGQATAYLTGMLIIQELRADAEARLGDDFDIRRFHDFILEDGAVPISYLRTKIERWVKEQDAEAVGRRSGDDVVRPGDPSLLTSRLVDRVDSLRMWQMSGDERRKGSLQVETIERFEAEGEPRLRFVFRVEGARGVLLDTTVVRFPSLEPIRHSSHLPPGRPWTALELRYEGDAVNVAITPPDSAARSFRVELSEPAFDPSLSDLILGALPLENGYEARVPMFSHGSRSVQYYTFGVLGDGRETRGDESVAVWQVDVKLSDGPSYRAWVEKETGRIVRTETPLGPDRRIVAIPEGPTGQGGE